MTQKPIALEAKARMDRGELVDDATIIEIVKDRLRQPDPVNLEHRAYLSANLRGHRVARRILGRSVDPGVGPRGDCAG